MKIFSAGPQNLWMRCVAVTPDGSDNAMDLPMQSCTGAPRANIKPSAKCRGGSCPTVPAESPAEATSAFRTCSKPSNRRRTYWSNFSRGSNVETEGLHKEQPRKQHARLLGWVTPTRSRSTGAHWTRAHRLHCLSKTPWKRSLRTPCKRPKPSTRRRQHNQAQEARGTLLFVGMVVSVGWFAE